MEAREPEMSELSEKIRTAVKMLEAIQKELEEKSRLAEHDAELAQQLDYELLSDFKRSLDHSRHLIWPYIIALQQHTPENIDYALQLYRMQRVREMLLAMRKDKDTFESDPKIRLFLSELQRIAGGGSIKEA
jgi:hypothetical protein